MRDAISLYDDGGRVRSLREIEYSVIEEMLLHTRGNRDEAAKLLAISRSKIYRMLDEHKRKINP